MCCAGALGAAAALRAGGGGGAAVGLQWVAEERLLLTNGWVGSMKSGCPDKLTNPCALRFLFSEFHATLQNTCSSHQGFRSCETEYGKLASAAVAFANEAHQHQLPRGGTRLRPT